MKQHFPGVPPPTLYREGGYSTHPSVHSSVATPVAIKSASSSGDAQQLGLLPVFRGLVIVIPSFTQEVEPGNSSSSSDPVVKYNIVCHHSQLQLRWTLSRRYSEFTTLHHHLTVIYRLHALEHRNIVGLRFMTNATNAVTCGSHFAGYIGGGSSRTSSTPSLASHGRPSYGNSRLTSMIHMPYYSGGQCGGGGVAGSGCHCGDFVLPTLPPKAGWFNHTNRDHAAIESRRVQLEAYLQNVVNKSIILPAFATVLVDFLGMKSSSFQQQLRQSLSLPNGGNSAAYHRKSGPPPPPPLRLPLHPPSSCAPIATGPSLVLPSTTRPTSPLTHAGGGSGTHSAAFAFGSPSFLSSPKIEVVGGTAYTPAIFVCPPKP